MTRSQPTTGPVGHRPAEDAAAAVGPAAAEEAAPAAGSAPAGLPVLAVVKGEPTPEELAALTAVVLSLGGGAPEAPAKPGARHWIRRQQLQLAPKPGPGSWKRSRG